MSSAAASPSELGGACECGRAAGLCLRLLLLSAYIANATVVTANGLMLRYAVEFVKLHEPVDYRLWLGWIVGVGMVGSLLMRLVQGGAIDRYGVRRMWVMSSSCLVGRVSGPSLARQHSQRRGVPAADRL